MSRASPHRALQRPCIICGAEATVVAAYQASGDGAERLGAEPGKTRIVFYSLCDVHPRDVQTAEKAERLLEVCLAADPPLLVPVEALDHNVAIFEADR